MMTTISNSSVTIGNSDGKRMRILVFPYDSSDHIRAFINIADALQKRGHSIMFVTNSHRESELAKYEFEQFFLDHETEAAKREVRHMDAEMYDVLGYEFDTTSIVTIFSSIVKWFEVSFKSSKMVQDLFVEDDKLAKVLQHNEPDLIIMDGFLAYNGLTSVLASNKPWALMWTQNPLALYDDDTYVPPPFTGFSIDAQNWLLNMARANWNFVKASVRQFVQARLLWKTGIWDYSHKHVIPKSPYLNIYQYPEELDYKESVMLMKEQPPMYALDTFSVDDKNVELPETLITFMKSEQKLIYVSIGSICSNDTKFMRKLTAILAKTSHKYIIAEGYAHKKLMLAENMWADRQLPQAKVLPKVDLVITHGGNDIVTEAFMYGVPMIIIPFYMDQLDNAQRVQDKHYGIRLARNYAESELLDAMDLLLNNETLKRDLKSISKGLLANNKLESALDLVENMHQG